MTFDDTHEYATWDAAYVLGALSSADRRGYEAHLSTCISCRLTVSELCGLPVLLRQLSRVDVAAIDLTAAPGPDTIAPLRPHLLSELLAEASRRRRRDRMRAWAIAAAVAVAVVTGVLLTCQASLAQTTTPRQAEGTLLTMTPVSTDEYSATVMLSSRGRVLASMPTDDITSSHIASTGTDTDTR